VKKTAVYKLEFTWDEHARVDAIIYVINAITTYIEHACYRFDMKFKLTVINSARLTKGRTESGLRL
jgi:hypothetical protein